MKCNNSAKQNCWFSVVLQTKLESYEGLNDHVRVKFAAGPAKELAAATTGHCCMFSTTLIEIQT
jgi:hypothetical protein